ncbi:hypothetical protein JCM3775_001417 [Rhodotorula graminis]
MAMLYDAKKNIERRLKPLRKGVTITYPRSSASVLLPLTTANNFEPEVLFCGGTTANLGINPLQLSAKAPASKQCSRMILNAAGLRKGWQTENMPFPRVMVLVVNGARSGIAGRRQRRARHARVPDRSATTLLPDGRILTAASDLNDGVSTKTYRTRYNIEVLSPPYMSMNRPSFSGQPAKMASKKNYSAISNMLKHTKGSK